MTGASLFISCLSFLFSRIELKIRLLLSGCLCGSQVLKTVDSFSSCVQQIACSINGFSSSGSASFLPLLFHLSDALEPDSPTLSLDT